MSDMFTFAFVGFFTIFGTVAVGVFLYGTILLIKYGRPPQDKSNTPKPDGYPNLFLRDIVHALWLLIALIIIVLIALAVCTGVGYVVYTVL